VGSATCIWSILREAAARDPSALADILVLWVTPATKTNNFGSSYIGEGSSEEDETFQVATGVVDVHHDPDW